MNRWIKLSLIFATSTVGTVFGDASHDHTIALATKKRADDKPSVQPAPVAPIVPQYDNRFGFSFIHLIYERTKNDSFYLGLDAWLDARYTSSSHHLDSLFEGELRFGYNLFYNQRDRITPFFGAGYLFNDVGHSRHNFHDAQFAYTTAGVLYTHDFNQTFSLGLNGKVLAGQQISNRYRKKFAWGIDVAIPFIFHLASSDWDITAEPYVLHIKSNRRHSTMLGSRGTIGYRF